MTRLHCISNAHQLSRLNWDFDSIIIEGKADAVKFPANDPGDPENGRRTIADCLSMGWTATVVNRDLVVVPRDPPCGEVLTITAHKVYRDRFDPSNPSDPMRVHLHNCKHQWGWPVWAVGSQRYIFAAGEAGEAE